MLLGRVLDIRERLFRPFLYLLIHHPSHTTLPWAVASFALKGIEACSSCAFRCVIRHRRHGSWYAARLVFTTSLQLVAAVKSGRVEVPKRWRQAVQNSVAMLRYWEMESPDLREARIILQDILQGLDMVGDHAHFGDDNSGGDGDDDADTHISEQGGCRRIIEAIAEISCFFCKSPLTGTSQKYSHRLLVIFRQAQTITHPC